MDGYPGIEHTLPITPKFDDVFQWYKATQVTNSPTLIVEYGGPFGEELVLSVRGPAARRQAAPLHASGRLRREDPSPRPGHRRQPGSGRLRGEGGVRDVAARAGRGEDRCRRRPHRRRQPWPAAGSGHALGDLAAAERRPVAARRAPRGDDRRRAKAIGLAQDVGSLEPGKLADIIVLDRDPLTNIRNTNSISLVMKNGRVYDANTLDEVYPRQRKLPAQQWMTGPVNAAAGIP